MSDSTFVRSDTDPNLILAALALQLNFLDRDTLYAALNAWAQDRSRPLGQVLVQQGALAAEDHLLLEALVRKHLQRPAGDPQKSLASHTALAAVSEQFQALTQPDLPGTLVKGPSVPTAPEAGPATPADSDTLVKPPGSAGPEATGTTPGQVTPSGVRYRTLRPHARGGLGEVFVALDKELGREVALKEIQTRHADHAESRSRFLLEAEITGGLEHPGIVPVYGLGSYADGRPFYAMRFIRGQSLQAAIAHFHEAGREGRDPGQRALELRLLLSRFVAVCNAIGYAHSRGIVHRDIKPANVMLGDFGETLVVDWGLAKVLSPLAPPPSATSGAGEAEKPRDASATWLHPASLNASTATQMGATLGTPAYMSPEQAAGKVDELGPASDVYSLGATLYQLLTGKAPFEDRDVVTLLERVQVGDFLPPRQRQSEVPPALDAICRKAMALRPEDRYASPQALAGEIENWLADEPVSAYREPLTARVARWARRHRTLVTASAVLLVAAVAGLTVTTVLVSREQARTAEQHRLADANFQTALGAVNDMLTEVAQEQLAPEPRMEKKRRALLARARTYYEQFLEERGSDPHVRKEAALAHKRLGDISRLLGEYDQARAAYDQAIGLLIRLTAEHSNDPEERSALAESWCNLGEVWRLTSHPQEARKAYRQALDLQRELVAEAPDQPLYRKELARTQYNRGILFKDTRQPREAEDAFVEAVKLLNGLAKDYPQDRVYRQHLARAYLNLAPVQQANGRPDEAEKSCEKAIRLQTDLVKEDPLTPDYRYELGASYINLGYLFESTRRDPQAEDAYRKALDRFNRLALDFPAVPVYRKELGLTENNLAGVLARGRKWAAAEDAWGRSLALFEKLAAEHPAVPDYVGLEGMALGNLGWLLLQQKDLPEKAARRKELLTTACERLERAMALERQALKPNPENPAYLQALRDQSEYLADARLALGEHAEAARVAQALPAIFRTRGEDYFLAAELLARCMAVAQNDQAASADYARRAMELLRQGIARGCKDAQRLSRPSFKPLQQRADFKKLLAQLKAGAP
jgi:serine/threonine-protein kinase